MMRMRQSFVRCKAGEAAKAFESFKGAPAILEGFVDFSYEASVVAARSVDGGFAAYDPPGE